MVFPMKARRKLGTKRSQTAFKRFVRAPRRDDRLMKCFVIAVTATSEASRYRGGGGIRTGWSIAFYEERKGGLGLDFETAARQALETIAAAPERWPTGKRGTRRYVMSRFPFVIHYIDMPN